MEPAEGVLEAGPGGFDLFPSQTYRVRVFRHQGQHGEKAADDCRIVAGGVLDVDDMSPGVTDSQAMDFTQ